MRRNVIWLIWILCVSHYAFSDAQDNGDDTRGGATALVISTNMLSHGPHTLATNDVADWFSVNLLAGQRYRFESTGDWDVDAELYSDIAAETPIATDQDHGDGLNFQIFYDSSASQTYYLKVYNFYEGYGEYTLGYLQESVFDEWDPEDDTYSNAPTLTMSEIEQVHGVHRLSAVDTQDWFHFYLLAGVEYVFRAVNGGWDTVGELYKDNGSGTPVASGDDDYDAGDSDNELNFIITYTPLVSADYYLRVSGYEIGDLDYSLIHNYVGSSDSDEDGQSDADEAIAGTDPNDDTSYFAVTNWSTGSFTIEWPAFPSRQYQVYRADSLTNTFNPIGPVIHYPQNSYTDNANSSEDSGFYKVEVQLQ